MSSRRPQRRLFVEVVRPFPETEYPSVWVWADRVWDKLFADDMPRELGTFVEFFKKQGELAMQWAVYRDGEIGGIIEVSLLNFYPGVASAHCLFKRSFWGKATTIVALNQVFAEVFANGVHAFVFYPFSHNVGVRAMHKRIGAIDNGPIAMGITQNGIPVESSLYVLTFERWKEFNPEFVKKLVAQELSSHEEEAIFAATG